VLKRRPARADARVPGEVVLESSPGWWGARGNVGTVTVRLEPSPPAACERWRNGEFDVMYAFLARLGGAVEDERTVVQRKPGGNTDYLGLDALRPPLDDVRVRRAVALAIDRRALQRSLGGRPVFTGGLLSPGLPGHSPRVAAGYDPDRARALVREVDGSGGCDLGEIVLTHFGIQQETASIIRDQLAAVGLRARSLPSYSTDALKANIDAQANAWLWSWGSDFADPAGGLLELLDWMPKLYRVEELDTLLARADASRDQDERLRAIREFEQLLIGEHAAVVPLAYHDRSLWRRPWVDGLWANALSASTFASAVVSDRPTRRR
jgi:peptide/nickel transport system substrate-binding protein